MRNTRVLVIKFKNELFDFEIPSFRGAVINALNENSNILFHNHNPEGFRYSYPLIQYKRIKEKASIICIDKGVDVIDQLFSKGPFLFRIGERKVDMEINSIKAHQILIQPWEKSFCYYIHRWLPLNSINYSKYQEIENLGMRIEFLEKILIGNILSFTKGLNLYMCSEIKCHLTYLSEPFVILNKGIGLMAFNVEFKCNVSIPDFVGIGKNASIGYGVVTQIYNK